MDELLVGGRDARFRYELLTKDDVLIGRLYGVTNSGSLRFKASDAVRSGGSAHVKGVGVRLDWKPYRIKVWYVIQSPFIDVPLPRLAEMFPGYDTFPGDDVFPEDDATPVWAPARPALRVASWPLGVFLASTPTTRYVDGVAEQDLDLFDKLQVPNEASCTESYSLNAGVAVTDTVRQILNDLGETNVAITASAETLSAGQVWEAGTSWLTIINDLLACINYFKLWCDGDGAYRADLYVQPAARELAHTFTAGASAVHLPDFSIEHDTYHVPNVVSLVARVDGDAAALTYVATNDDPNSPYSTVTIGRPIVHFESGIEATSAGVLAEIAERQLEEFARVAEYYDIDHGWLPLPINCAVGFRNPRTGEMITATLDEMEVPLDAEKLASSRLARVAA